MITVPNKKNSRGSKERTQKFGVSLVPLVKPMEINGKMVNAVRGFGISINMEYRTFIPMDPPTDFVKKAPIIKRGENDAYALVWVCLKETGKESFMTYWHYAEKDNVLSVIREAEETNAK